MNREAPSSIELHCVVVVKCRWIILLLMRMKRDVVIVGRPFCNFQSAISFKFL